MLVAWEGQEEKNRYKLVENREKQIRILKLSSELMLGRELLIQD